MTRVLHYRLGNERILSVDGHSDYSDNGVNTVCACVSLAVSVLYLALPARYKDGKGNARVDIVDGHARFEVAPLKGDEELIELLFSSTLEALRMIEREFPEHIQITDNEADGD